MKNLLVLILLAMFSSCPSLAFAGDSCDVEKVLGVRNIETGIYKIKVKKEDSNLYEVVGKNIYIKTRYCYKYTYGTDAILEIESSYGYTIGKLYFLD